ncbi:unnamed protein product [Cyprideis torosa]|uniref:Uncharacterized protein n=1 Tax=Cyprideis torosa TaxID=163714 RepID=A0A7R8ZUK9_9CRUS|nr:unnamed protein product [Cyprideis torosa]CAG0906225.1 unnamed protein product [Cyprideis torosa]
MCESDANPPPVIWGCPEGFQMAGEGCYHFGDQVLDFDNSLTYCRGLGGKLVEFETAEEMYEFNDYFKQNQPTPCDDVYYWIGGDQRFDSLVWEWVSSRHPVPVYNWANSIPSNYNYRIRVLCPDCKSS